MGLTWSQLFPPDPTFTERDLPDLSGKVYIVTGGYAGIGYHVSSMLYHAGATVWIAGRTESTGWKAIADIQAHTPSTPLKPGHLHFLQLELNDLSTIKPAVDKFKATEQRLDVLFNNAGMSRPPAGLKSAQGEEIVVATNCTGPYLLTTLLLPILRETAAMSLPGSVRIVWAASQVVEGMAPRDGMDFSVVEDPPSAPNPRYVTSKLGNVYLASVFADAEKARSERQVISVAQNPGNLKTAIMRNSPLIPLVLTVFGLLHEAYLGAYTELYAGLSQDISEENNGAYVIPWGRLHPGLSEELVKSMRPVEENGTGKAQKFCDILAERSHKYL